jgi:egghead protein (zeste-white 4 protein)
MTEAAKSRAPSLVVVDDPSMERAMPGAHYGWTYRIAVLLAFLAVFFTIFFLQDAVWPRGREPRAGLEQAVSYLSIAWVLPLAPAVLGLIGLLIYRRPFHATGAPRSMATSVSFRVVSRGTNPGALVATCRNIHETMAVMPLFPYVVEVVTDRAVGGLPPGTQQLVVPPDFRTPNGSLYKARALHYALDVSAVAEDAWIMHLDEESHISRSLVVGIVDAVCEEEESGRYRIGQGAILYHRNLATHRFLTLADMIRSGEDLGRFHFQHRLGITLFGLHGSFILVRNSVEREVGFDFGPEGSITEDAFWALRQMEHGRRCRWVDGYVVEQSCYSVRDFVKQRRRWFVGLWLVAVRAPSALRWRLALGTSTALWSISWIAVTYTYVNLATGVSTPLPIRLIGNFVFAFYLVEYVLGLKINLDHRPPIGRLAAAKLYALQVILVPVFQLMEGASVLYGIVRPDMRFHIVRK